MGRSKGEGFGKKGGKGGMEEKPSFSLFLCSAKKYSD